MKIELLHILFFLNVLSLHAVEENLFRPLSSNNQIVKTTKRIILEDYPDSFNPSLIKTDAGLLLTFRHSPNVENTPWISYIGVVFLNENLETITEPQLLNTRSRTSKTPSQAEDARIFSYRNRLFLIYNDNIDTPCPNNWDRRDMFIAELTYADNQFSLSTPLKLYYPEKYRSRLVQKNWVPFEWNKSLLLTYMINPHEILYPNLINGTCYRCYETGGNLDWNYGELRGSTPPTLVDGEYLAFFHSGKKMSSSYSFDQEIWHYFAGAYTFEAMPPFRITKMSREPIIGEKFYTLSSYYKRVIFPGGCVVSGDSIYLAYGKDDCEIWIATLDKTALKDSLREID